MPTRKGITTPPLFVILGAGFPHQVAARKDGA
jgi:hypothetical protein